MSDIFYKNTYSVRSPGYKYRSLSTNTGQKDSNEDDSLQSNFKQLKKTIHSKIQNEINQIADTREALLEKFKKVDMKIDSMIKVQNTVLQLRSDLHEAENKLADMLKRVARIESAMYESDISLRTEKKHTTLQL